jgi:hypothetical protein
MASNTVPYRQVRAQYDDETITVYQAYSDDIGKESVEKQRLDASPLFKCTRTTWVKPSWAWMMYRAGYSYKDDRQARILALKMKHEDFQNLLKRGKLTNHGPSGQSKSKSDEAVVNIQWDPERAPNMDKLPYRSIQIGIPGVFVTDWVKNGIVSIEDVTDKARKLKAAVDQDSKISLEDLIKQGLVPEEKPYELPIEIQNTLQMDKRE